MTCSLFVHSDIAIWHPFNPRLFAAEISAVSDFRWPVVDGDFRRRACATPIHRLRPL